MDRRVPGTNKPLLMGEYAPKTPTGITMRACCFNAGHDSALSPVARRLVAAQPPARPMLRVHTEGPRGREPELAGPAEDRGGSAGPGPLTTEPPQAKNARELSRPPMCPVEQAR